MRKRSYGFVFGVLLTLSPACAHRPSRTVAAEPIREVKVSEPVQLELKVIAGRVEETQIHCSGLTRTFENTQLLREHLEDLDFIVQAKNQLTDQDNGLIQQELITTQKQGEGDLHAMAYPDVGETLLVTLNKQAQVFHVGGFSPNSLFYVPNISLPSNPVTVGDSWPLTSEWMTNENGVPLRLKMVSHLIRLVECGSQSCAEIEVSGQVDLAVTPQRPMEFKSELKGMIYFGLVTGAIVWSQVRNKENLISEKQRVQIESCLESRLQSPSAEKRDFSANYPGCTTQFIKNAQDHANLN